MNVGSVIKRVRSIAGDTAVMQFTDEDIIDWLNDGIRECAIQNGLLQKIASTSTAVGTSEYDMPVDVMKLHSVTVDSMKLQAQTLQEWQATSESSTSGPPSGAPDRFYVWATKIVLYPVPSQVKPLKINYTYKPADLTFVDNSGTSGVGNGATKAQDIPLPSEYQGRMVDYCLAQVAQQDGDGNMYQMKMQEFQTGVTQLKDKPEYQEDQYPYITISDRDSGLDYY